MLRGWFFKIEAWLIPSAILFMLMLFLFPSISYPQEARETASEMSHEMTQGMTPHAHSSAPIPGSPEDRAYSEFMHQLNGVFVLLLGVLAILEQRLTKAGLLRWGWPLLFLLSGIYLAIQSDQDGWPIGDKGFIESLQDPVIFQHKVAVVILLLLGFSELFLRTRWQQPLLAGVFPLLAVSAGILLFLHAGHTGHHSPKIYWQHLGMGGTAMSVGVTRFISGRLKGSERVWPILILLLGLELLFYTE